ncbi:MAG: nucleotidyl transferase AbiEii/AbiGii toxin family protein [Fibrobacter sp.]|nr:nucleotidyl transferase AbiEii/AbiGii toxin family protein [Fibrobacter sp.]
MDLLKKIQSESVFGNYRLVGGTALALQYGHRKSIDLDFFGFFESDAMLVKSILQKMGHYQIVQESKFIFQYIVDGVKVDFVNYPYPWISPKVEEDNLTLASPKDIAAMKLSAITNRGTKKDFIDLYELLDHFTLEQMFEFYREKYADAIPFMTLKSLTWFEDAEDDPMPFMLRDYSWETVKAKIIAEVAHLG